MLRGPVVGRKNLYDMMFDRNGAIMGWGGMWRCDVRLHLCVRGEKQGVIVFAALTARPAAESLGKALPGLTLWA